MTILLTQLQGAMGLGMLLYELAIILLVVVFPVVWIVTTIRTIRKDKVSGHSIGKTAYTNAIMRGLLISILTLVIIAVILVILIYLFVDLSIS